MIKCSICEKECKNTRSLSGHIIYNHDISIKDYYDKYIKKENEEICPSCGKKMKFFGIGGYTKHCSRKCVMMDENVKKQMNDTYFKKTGYTHQSKNPKVKKKKEETNLLHCGRTNPMKDSDIRKKASDTYNKRTGFNNPFKNPDVQTIAKRKYKERTGYDHWTKNPKTQERKIETCNKIYNVDNISQLEEIKQIKKDKSVEIFGTDCTLKNLEVHKKSVDTLIKNFGTDNYFKTEEAKRISRINGIKYTEIQKLHGEPLCPRIGSAERSCLNELEQYTPNKKIIRNNHDYAYIIGRFPDGEVDGLPLFIQYNEKHHYIDKETMKIENDLTKQQTLDLASNQNIGPRIVFSISEKNWLENKQKIINQFQLLIENLQHEHSV